MNTILPRENARVVGALEGDGPGGHPGASPVRKERLKGKSKQELKDEAARVLHQADRIECVTAGTGVSPEKFYTLPTRKKGKVVQAGSLDRRSLRRSSLELNPLKKPPRTFATVSTPNISGRASIFDLFKKDKKPQHKKSNLRRSVSDASETKSKVYGQNDRRLKGVGSESEESAKKSSEKKQLSPIIEVTQREDYFSAPEEDTNKENIINVRAPIRKKKKESVTEKLKQYIDEVDEEIYRETGIRVTPSERVKQPQPIIIDVDKAEKISDGGKKFKHTSIGKKLKSITHRKNKTNEGDKIKRISKQKTEIEERVIAPHQIIRENIDDNHHPGLLIKTAIENLEHPKDSPKMIHSSQKPVDKLPLTRGRAVNSMVKRLSNDSCSPPPPKTNIMITPMPSVQHNNNKPFSYTRGSPDKYNESPPNVSSPIIYAQVVCGNNANGPSKQTIHTTYTNGKKHPHSDSDEGLGGEENPGFIRMEKSVTHFGDDKRISKFFDEVDNHEAERPIKPKLRSPPYNGYSSYERKIEHKGYIDSSSRGRGDGMDAKRRESLTEPHENGLFSTNFSNGRSDLAARRDQLESRITRRLNDNTLRTSPEYVKNSSPSNLYISETTSKYYRGRSSSPVGNREKFISETRTDEYGESHVTESRSTQYFGEPKDRLQLKTNLYNDIGLDSEPKSFDSQLSDYRSSPENRKIETSHRYNNKVEGHALYKDRNMYKSTPEIHMRSYQEEHDSLRRENIDARVSSSKYRSDRYIDDNERKDKFGDSGIENDFRRDSAENSRATRSRNSRRDFCNESEDEGFASSLLIASERQHTENNINQRRRREYDSDRTHSREDDPYRNLENLEYKQKYRADDYTPRERSIDDGSHYDPRIDKDIERSTMKRTEKKPPKPEKKSGLEKVKSLFTRDSKKKKEKQQPSMVREESLRARYVEYKAREPVEEKYKRKEATDVKTGYDYSNRRRLSTPSPSPTREPQRNGKIESSHGSWFKSLDRLSRKKSKAGEKEGNFTSGTEEETPSKPTPTKSLRFFGDTDIESNDSVRHKSSLKQRSATNLKARSQSTRDLHNISDDNSTHRDLKSRSSSYKSMNNVSETERDLRGSRSTLKPPMSPNHQATRNTPSRQDKDRSRRRKNEVSSVESSTEGDSSQQSQRSVVYLHAATVGDIPGPGYLRNSRRSASREELASNSSSRLQPQVKTLSRSFSVLAPWGPRHVREGMDIDYTQYPKPVKNGKYEQKINKSSSNRKDNSSTLKKKAQETRKNQANSTLKKSKSKENVSTQALRRSREDISKGSTSTLYKKKERLPRENSRYSRDKEERKVASKSFSVESLGSNGRNYRENGRDISRSVSMPRNPEKSAGWFKMPKKNKLSSSTQRL